MLTKLFVSFILFCTTGALYANDTTWLNARWRPCKKAQAVYFEIKKQEDSRWKQSLYYVSTSRLYMTGVYSDSLCKVRDGSFLTYDLNGRLSDSTVYKRNSAMHIQKFHPNGEMKTLLVYGDTARAVFVNSWNQEGCESEADTFYHDYAGKNCHKDTAHLKGVITKTDGLWRLRFYKRPSFDSIYIDSWYLERSCKTRIRTFTYFDNGAPYRTYHYNNTGQKLSSQLFHSNGRLCTELIYDEKGKVKEGRTYNESGEPVLLDTTFIKPHPLSKEKEWLQDLNNKIASIVTGSDNLKKPGKLTVMFTVDENGSLLRIRPFKKSSNPELDDAILSACRVLQWKPATYHGRRIFCEGVHEFFYDKGVIAGYKFRFKDR